MEAQEAQYDATPIFDSFDVDLLVKVLAHTAFSRSHIPYLWHSAYTPNQSLPGPFFTFFIPVFYYFQGARWSDGIVVYSAIYCAAMCAFCGSPTIAFLSSCDSPSDVFALSKGSSSGTPACTGTKETCSSARHVLTGENRLWSLLVVRVYQFVYLGV